MPSAHQFQKVDPTLAAGALKPAKKFIADMGAVAVFAFMSGTGIVHIDISGHFESDG